jgi:hypothetical protein
MSDTDVPQIIGSTDVRGKAAVGEVRANARPLRFLGWLTFLVLAVGLISLLSYSLTASELMRSDNPALAAWWEAHQFHFMEGGATAFGLLLGIRIVGAFVAGPDQRSRAGLAALVLAIIAFAPLIHVCAMAARLGWNGRGASFASWLISHEGYEIGRQIDKVMIAGVYFLKTAGFALLAGLGLMAIACVAAVALEPANTETGKI